MRELNIYTIKKLLETNVKKSFKKEEITYLGLTSKIEIQLRDKLAFELYNEFKEKYITTREWKNCDLAILDINTLEPVILIEFKACYSCDLTKPSTLKEYVNGIKKDIEKSKKLATSNTKFYSILFVTKPQDIIPNNLTKIIKYSNSINSANNKYGGSLNVENYGDALFRCEFNNLLEGHIKKDIAFGIECSFDFFIIINENQ